MPEVELSKGVPKASGRGSGGELRVEASGDFGKRGHMDAYYLNFLGLG
jgi:hypothetical protein